MSAVAAILAGALALASPPSGEASPGIALVLPIDCRIGETCFIQHYVDHDPGPGAKDYRCGVKTYDGHDGIDFRIPDMAAERAGVKVLAAADGAVLRTRDGVQDISVRQIGLEAVKNIQCGNGVVIAHANGWETQYCHMKKGSVLVHPGDAVKAGQPIGEVGLSGNTEFAHVHLTVRLNGVKVDPFDYGAPMDQCGIPGQSLWAPDLAKRMVYTAPEVINTGFASGPVSMADVESGEARQMAPTPESLGVVAYVRTIGLEAGDTPSLSLSGPDGSVLGSSGDPPLNHSKDQYLTVAGARLTGARWPKGVYRAAYTVTRDGRPILTRQFEMKF